MKLKISQSLLYSVVCTGLVLSVNPIYQALTDRPDPALGGSESLLDPVAYTPENGNLIGSVIDVRATYLLDKFRRSGEALLNAESYQLELTQRVTTLQMNMGLFDGNAVDFGELSNVYSELLAVEMCIFWLRNPQSAKTKISIPLNEPIKISETETDEW